MLWVLEQERSYLPERGVSTSRASPPSNQEEGSARPVVSHAPHQRYLGHKGEVVDSCV